MEFTVDFRSVFLFLIRGMTFEQAKGDIRLSGDIAQLGEAAARIAINDGLAVNRRNKKYSKDIYDDIYYPKTTSEQSAFNRSMANKTSGLKDGESKRIIIYTADYVYLVTAEGYLKGNIEEVISLNGNQETINNYTREWINSDTSDEGFNLLLEAYGNESGGHNNSSDDARYRGKENANVKVDSKQSHGKGTGDTGSGIRNNEIRKGKVSIAPGIRIKSTDLAILKRIARSGNVAVVIERFSGAESVSKGYYDGVLHLNAEKLSEGGFSYTGIHESVHHVARVNPEGYKSIEQFIENYYKEKGVDIKAEIKATQELYKRRGVELTAEAAMEEIVCNTLSDIATDADALTAFMGLDGKAQNKFIEALKAIARKLKEWANKCLGNTEYHSIVLEDADTLLSLAKRFRAELENAGQKNNTADNGGVKYDVNLTFDNNDNITYDSLIEKDDMLISEVRSSLAYVKTLSREDVVEKARENLSHKKDSRGVIIIHNADTENDIAVGAPGLSHGLDRNFEYTAMVTLNLESYLENAIKINEAIADKNRKHDSDILLGYGETVTGEKIPAYFVVSKLTTGLDELVEFGSLYSIKAKKIAEDSTQGSPGVQSRTSATISISELLDIVNESYSDILPQSVAEHYGIEKRKTKLGKSVKFSLSPEADSEYLAAVESGDMEIAQRLVDEAAEVAMKDSKIRDKSGKLVKVYHGSDSADFYEFDKQRRGQTDSSMYGRGYYFAFDPDYSSDFGDNIREFYLDIKNPFYIDINAPAKVIADFLISKGVEVDFDYRNMICHFFAKNFGSQKFADTLVDLGFDGVIVRTDEGDYWETVAFHRNQMKLADAVTYDNDGNVIPISERFDFEKKDIRYSFGEEDINTDYSDLSKLDDKSRKVYNDRGWAMSLFTDEDKALLSQRLGEIFHKDSNYVRTTLGDGTVVLDLNNKMLLVSGGELGKEVIHGVVAINAPSESYAIDLKEDIISESENSWYTRETFSEFLRIIQRVQEAEDFRFYDGNDFYYQKGTHDTGDRATLPNEWENFGFTTGKQNRAGVSSEAQRGVPGAVSKVNDKSYSFGEEDLDYGTYVSEEREGAENLKESGRAVGGLFEATREAKLEEAEINRVLNRHLKNFKVTAEFESHRARVAQIVSLAERQDYVDGGAVVGEIATVMKDAVIDSTFV